jgi:anti-sigma-K factor RskA
VDLSCIISSGDLELYVLGLLPKEEAEKVDALIILFPEIKEEVDRISETLIEMSAHTSAVPGKHVKENLFEQFNKLKAETASSTNNTDQDKLLRAGEQEISRVKVVPITKNRSSLLLAASTIGLLLSIGAVIFLAVQNSNNKKELASMEQRVNDANTSLNQQQQQNTAYSQMMQILQDPNFTGINLQQVPGKPKALVKVFWNKQSNEVILLNVSLPTPPSDKQYQLWAIVDGKPVSAGLLDNRNQQPQKMASFAKAEAFAITLEPRGGSTDPTMEEMYVMGAAS